MIATEQTTLIKGHLRDLERTVAALDNRLQSIQWGLQLSTIELLVGHFRSVMRSQPRSRFMSTVCNQHIRSNTKLASHDGPRT